MATDERRALVQSESHGPDWLRNCHVANGTISWEEHEEAWQAYARLGHTSQSAERINERGGFGVIELTYLLGRPPMTWRPR